MRAEMIKLRMKLNKIKGDMEMEKQKEMKEKENYTIKDFFKIFIKYTLIDLAVSIIMSIIYIIFIDEDNENND